MAVLDRGRLCFRGAPRIDLPSPGKVWQIASADGNKPNNGLTVVSTLHLAGGVQYRVVGKDATGYPGAQPAQPSLEDGYVWLMQNTA